MLVDDRLDAQERWRRGQALLLCVALDSVLPCVKFMRPPPQTHPRNVHNSAAAQSCPPLMHATAPTDSTSAAATADGWAAEPCRHSSWSRRWSTVARLPAGRWQETTGCVGWHAHARIPSVAKTRYLAAGVAGPPSVGRPQQSTSLTSDARHAHHLPHRDFRDFRSEQAHTCKWKRMRNVRSIRTPAPMHEAARVLAPGAAKWRATRHRDRGRAVQATPLAASFPSHHHRRCLPPPSSTPCAVLLDDVPLSIASMSLRPCVPPL